ncbi:hypothetical protein C8J57DRAFT_1480844 [Mycena rebaudengoi]|nr:hypothetical protein C8J57DRAFT_1480844 [Mycena rebaudengoi]
MFSLECSQIGALMPEFLVLIDTRPTLVSPSITDPPVLPASEVPDSQSKPQPPALPAPVSPSITDPVLPASEVPDSQPKPQDATHKRQRGSEDAEGPTDAAAGSQASGGKHHKRAKTQKIARKKVEGDQAAQPLRRSSREKPTTNSTASVPKVRKRIVNPEGGPRDVQDIRTPLSGKDMPLWIPMETTVTEDGGCCEATAGLSLSSSLSRNTDLRFWIISV